MSIEKLPPKGTYTLVIGIKEPSTVEVGSIGEIEFKPPEYAYTGSAFGTGGMKRVQRHRRTATGKNDTYHWHIDYLLGSDISRFASVCVTRNEAECEIAKHIQGGFVTGFGASDCGCKAHLKRAGEKDVLEAYEDVCGDDGYAVYRFDG